MWRLRNKHQSDYSILTGQMFSVPWNEVLSVKAGCCGSSSPLPLLYYPFLQCCSNRFSSGKKNNKLNSSKLANVHSYLASAHYQPAFVEYRDGSHLTWVLQSIHHKSCDFGETERRECFYLHCISGYITCWNRQSSHSFTRDLQLSSTPAQALVT